MAVKLVEERKVEAGLGVMVEGEAGAKAVAISVTPPWGHWAFSCNH